MRRVEFDEVARSKHGQFALFCGHLPFIVLDQPFELFCCVIPQNPISVCKTILNLIGGMQPDSAGICRIKDGCILPTITNTGKRMRPRFVCRPPANLFAFGLSQIIQGHRVPPHHRCLGIGGPIPPANGDNNHVT